MALAMYKHSKCLLSRSRLYRDFDYFPCDDGERHQAPPLTFYYKTNPSLRLADEQGCAKRSPMGGPESNALGKMRRLVGIRTSDGSPPPTTLESEATEDPNGSSSTRQHERWSTG